MLTCFSNGAPLYILCVCCLECSFRSVQCSRSCLPRLTCCCYIRSKNSHMACQTCSRCVAFVMGGPVMGGPGAASSPDLFPLSDCRPSAQSRTLNILSVFICSVAPPRRSLDCIWSMCVVSCAVFGCADMTTSFNATVVRDGDRLTVKCNRSEQIWYLVCVNNTWHGEPINCVNGMHHVYVTERVMTLVK
jgi:hypothetical protein